MITREESIHEANAILYKLCKVGRIEGISVDIFNALIYKQRNVTRTDKSTDDEKRKTRDHVAAGPRMTWETAAVQKCVVYHRN